MVTTMKALIDTNILIYSYDTQDAKRQQRALQLLSQLHRASAGYLSVKTLSEFFVAMQRIYRPISVELLLGEMQKLSTAWPVLDLTSAIALEAARGVRDYQFGYWDAQMWATAKTHKLDALFTEDMNPGSVAEGVALVNPLTDSFDFER